jgi:hypothetical protein
MTLLQQVSERMNSVKMSTVEVNECFKTLHRALQDNLIASTYVKRQLKVEV